MIDVRLVVTLWRGVLTGKVPKGTFVDPGNDHGGDYMGVTYVKFKMYTQDLWT